MTPKRILMISPTPTHPRGAGNRARIETMLQNLVASGHEVTFLHVEREKGDRDAMKAAWGGRYVGVSYKRPASIMGQLRKRLSRERKESGLFNFRVDDWYDRGLDKELEKLHREKDFEVVIVEYVFMSRALLVFGDRVIKIIDTHDMFTDRHQRYLDEGQEPRWFSTTAAEEGKAFDRANYVLAITSKEQDAFAQMTRTPVITVGHFVSCERRNHDSIVPNALLFVASDNPINVHGLKWFLEEVFPILRERRSECELWVVGTVASEISDQDGVIRKGRIDDLSEVYHQAHVVVNPVRFNTGLSIKNLEAMAYSCPLVSSVCGADGLERGAGVAYLTADEPEDFAAQIERVLADTELEASLSREAFAAAVRWNEQAMRELYCALGA